MPIPGGKVSYFHLPLLVITCYFPILLATYLTSPMLGCPDRCGIVEIDYPFGVGDGCFFPGFEVICNQSIPFLAQTNLSILSILNGEVRIDSTQFIITCNPPPRSFEEVGRFIELPKTSPYTLSIDSNKFVIMGCNVMGSILQMFSEINRCNSMCVTKESVINGSCTGHGCCESPLPSSSVPLLTTDLPFVDKLFFIALRCDDKHLDLMSYGMPTYGFVVEDGSYDFIESDLRDFNRNISMKLEWSIGEGNCSQAMESNSSLCAGNSYCIKSKRGYGYLCKCLQGYQGNPYLPGTLGCQDIDECSTGSNLCVPKATCQNRVPGYTCVCPHGTIGNGFKLGSGCHKRFPLPQAILATSAFIMFCIPCLTFSYWIRKKNNKAKVKGKYYRQNGGFLLQECSFSSTGTSRKRTKIFSARELRKATDNYNSKRFLGSGCQGTVNKGTLDDGSTVAIKKLYAVAQNQVHQFIEEILILTQIDHKNIARLLGCCLETQVPFLVYEFISGDTLYQKLHGDANDSTPLSWKSRLKTATEIAEALSHLHSCASMPIVHRDVKSSNILLDKNHEAKLIDFGVSMFISQDKNWVLTVMKGTRVYLDPEYFETGNLTEKSDVYSFGVVLVELLSGQIAIQHEQTQDYNILVTHFLSCVERRDLFKIVDEGILREGRTDDLQATMEIARRCLSFKGEERPTMKEVQKELALLIR